MISDGKNRFLKDGLNADIIKCWQSCYEEFKSQPQKIVKSIYSIPSIDEQCMAIFGYLVDHVSYQLDDAGYQYIKSPARLLDDKCGDCKSFTMFIASCLYCLGIPCIVRFVNFDGGDQYTHVYPVAIDEQGKEIILDACEKDDNGIVLYDYARPYKRKKDLIYE